MGVTRKEFDELKNLVGQHDVVLETIYDVCSITAEVRDEMQEIQRQGVIMKEAFDNALKLMDKAVKLGETIEKIKKCR